MSKDKKEPKEGHGSWYALLKQMDSPLPYSSCCVVITAILRSSGVALYERFLLVNVLTMASIMGLRHCRQMSRVPHGARLSTMRLLRGGIVLCCLAPVVSMVVSACVMNRPISLSMLGAAATYNLSMHRTLVMAVLGATIFADLLSRMVTRNGDKPVEPRRLKGIRLFLWVLLTVGVVITML